MRLLKERSTPTQNIALMGISVAAITALAILATFVPLSAFVILLFLPLISALTAYYCQPKYIIPYVVGAILVVVASTCYDLSSSLFDVVPTILTGSLFGFLLKREFPSSWAVLMISLLQLGINYLMLLLIRGIYGVDVIETALTLLGLQEKANIREIVPAFLYVYALIEAGISFLVIIFSIHNIEKIEERDSLVFSLVGEGTSLLFLVLAIILSFFSPMVGYLLGVIGIYLCLTHSRDLFRKNPWWVFLILGLLIMASFYLSAFFFQSLPPMVSPLLFLTIFISVSLSSLLSSLLFKTQERKNKA